MILIRLSKSDFLTIRAANAEFKWVIWKIYTKIKIIKNGKIVNNYIIYFDYFPEYLWQNDSLRKEMIPTVTSINIKNCLQIRGEAKRPEPPDRCNDRIQNVNLQNFASWLQVQRNET